MVGDGGAEYRAARDGWCLMDLDVITGDALITTAAARCAPHGSAERAATTAESPRQRVHARLKDLVTIMGGNRHRCRSANNRMPGDMSYSRRPSRPLNARGGTYRRPILSLKPDSRRALRHGHRVGALTWHSMTVYKPGATGVFRGFEWAVLASPSSRRAEGGVLYKCYLPALA